jgi:hypothetical protein
MPIEDKESGRCPIECPNSAELVASEKKKIPLEYGIADGETRTRTGDTTILSCESESLDCREIPAIQAVYSIRWQRVEVRRLRSFLADLGTRMRFGAQWAGGWPDRSGAGPDQTQAAGATKTGSSAF